MRRRPPWRRDAHTRALRELRRRAEAMTRGDFSALGRPVGGDRDVEDLRRAMDVLGAHVQQAQLGMQDYIAALTTAQEAERGRLARELHDDTVQRLVALGQGVERAQRLLTRDVAAAHERLNALRAEITALVQAVRAMIGDLRPPALEELGLLPAIELLIRRNAESIPAITITTAGQPRRLEPQSELALFRIVQEALRNAQQHAQASQVTIALHYGPDSLEAIIADDGRGFKPPATGEAARGHFGLLSMQERAQLAGGSLTIESAPGQGTRLTVRLPYPGYGGRDPICDMPVGPEAISVTYAGALYRFCSPACRDLFLTEPARYAARLAHDA
ncbi:ATP-binding protein [Kallotenue papyrolyticum]|uniref:ATP-binding protein n=1 Tax=Kallotenue papyrolyticum TaxID=1325125 RepID=UPI000478655A|nr:ATP-binding protein [Kallotenue papyrolyticum]